MNVIKCAPEHRASCCNRAVVCKPKECKQKLDQFIHVQDRLAFSSFILDCGFKGSSAKGHLVLRTLLGWGCNLCNR